MKKFFLSTFITTSCFLLFVNIAFAVDERAVEETFEEDIFKGTAIVGQDWRADDEAWEYELPFTFNFYGVDYTDILISSNGYICLDDSMDCSEHNIELDDTSIGPFIAPLNVNLMTDWGAGNNIFITEEDEYVVIRWDAVEYKEGRDSGDDAIIIFEVVLYSNGNIQFDYMYFDEDLYEQEAIVGISKGDGTTYVESVYNGNVDFDMADSSFWSNDEISPTISEKTSVSTPTTDTTPDYTFDTDEAGTIAYGGSCSSATTDAAIGNNTITFKELSAGIYSDCTITVTDGVENASNILEISTFTIEEEAVEEKAIDEEIADEDDSVSGTTMQKYKRYKEKYKNQKSRKANKEIKKWKKGTAEEFAQYIEYRNIYKEYKHLSKRERKAIMTPGDYEKYQMYKRYKGYKEYKKLRDEVK